MNTDEFPDHIPVADLGVGSGPLYIYKVLRLHAEGDKRVNIAIAADDSVGFDDDVGSKARIGANTGIGADGTKGPDNAIVANFSSWIDHCELIYMNQFVPPKSTVIRFDHCLTRQFQSVCSNGKAALHPR